tara:strand:+ start:72 stop:755 length:684 start_codon:yes stop_codon:yes gene_type:complete
MIMRGEIFFRAFLFAVLFSALIVALMFSFFKKSESDMWLLVGLGNPGSKYEGNRHNVGFHVIDAIADEYGIGPFKSKFNAEIAEGRIGDQKAVLIKPQTYMNESGQSVGKAAKFFKITKARTIVFHDELDLAPAKMRVKVGGGVAGHNGLKSIRAHLGSPDFKRVRIGIGHPGDRNRVSGYVLNDFSKAEQPAFEELVGVLARQMEILLTEGDELYMTRVSEALPKK